MPLLEDLSSCCSMSHACIALSSNPGGTLPTAPEVAAQQLRPPPQMDKTLRRDADL